MKVFRFAVVVVVVELVFIFGQKFIVIGIANLNTLYCTVLYGAHHLISIASERICMLFFVFSLRIKIEHE